MATQLGGGGTPVSAAQAESKQPQRGAERLLHDRGPEVVAVGDGASQDGAAP